jgi:hypothetical protein
VHSNEAAGKKKAKQKSRRLPQLREERTYTRRESTPHLKHNHSNKQTKKEEV